MESSGQPAEPEGDREQHTGKASFMRRVIRVLAAALGVAVVAAALPLGLLASAATASAAPTRQQAVKPMGLVMTPNVPHNGTFNIHNANANGKCIGIDSSGKAGDWNCTSNRDQTWQWGSAIQPGWLQLINGNGKCLGVQAGSDAVGARIVAFTCLGTGHPDQYWALGAAGFGGNNINNFKAFFDPNTPAQLIGVAGGSTANGAAAVLWSFDGTANQFWF
jgi:Ricin-type beta-trefoil lectin domain-like